jgi:ABC-type dipeptide/oligopeptide/nickel transport system permease component
MPFILLSVLNRLVLAAVTLLGVAVVVFVLLRVVPGDPIAMMISPGSTPEQIAQMRAHYGLDGSIANQFWIWLKSILSGDFGTSISLRRNVLELLGERLPATLELAAAALLFAILLGGAVAIVGTLVRRTFLEPVVDTVNGTVLAVPDFIWALALILVFGVFFPVFPLSGRIDPSVQNDFATSFYLLESLVTLRFGELIDISSHMIMPVLALGLPLAAIIARVLKEALLEAMVQDYILLAKLRGKSNLRLILQEALRNAVGPTIALTGVQFTS